MPDNAKSNIETKLFQRQGKSETNFTRTLPPEQSDMAQQILKDPYHFDFLTLGPSSRERALERGLLNHLKDLLLELGKGFAFLGSQYKIEVDERPYYIGLILCKGKGKTTVEYALRDTNKPIGVSSYQHTLELPQPLQGEMPSIEDLADAIDQLKEDQDGDPTTMG
jgi:predicted nuclease of restriction endonuclease-like (RecB) superfamily